MLDVTSSDKEDWKRSGIDGAGFWSRWYLWGHPTFEGAQEVHLQETFWCGDYLLMCSSNSSSVAIHTLHHITNLIKAINILSKKFVFTFGTI
jgi:hypothetical protein